MKIICSLTHLSLTLGGKKLFDQASLTFTEGDRIGLLGLNGHGKSSLFKVLAEELAPDTTTPPILFDKSKAFCLPNGKLDLFFIPQDCNLDLHGHLSIEDYFWQFYPMLAKVNEELDRVNEQLNQNNTSPEILQKQKDLIEILEASDAWSLQQRFESYLSYFEITELKTPIVELSGGQQKKILLSLGLSTSSPVILWDEPTNHLDLETLEYFEQELQALSKSYFIISHDRTFLAKVTNKILSIKGKKLHPFNGSYADYLAHLEEKETERQLVLQRLKNTLKRETDWMRQGIKARGTRSKKRVENFHDLSSRVKQLKDEAHRKLQLTVDSSQRKTKILVDIKELNFSYDHDPVFTNLNLELWRGDKVGLIGPNGAGKSTLLKLITGELRPTTGLIKRPDDLTIAYFSQNREELDPDLTAFQYLGDGKDTVIQSNGQPLHLNSYLDRFLFEREDAHKSLKVFSGGERNRLQLAKHLLKKADLWIFDEPTNDLDLETLEILEKTLIDLKGTLILISHDRSFLSGVTNKVWLMTSSGVEKFEGGYAQAEDYIAVRQLEDQLKNEVPQKKKSQSDPLSPKQKALSESEVKAQREKLEQDIAQYEQVIEKITESLSVMEASGDFSPEKAKSYGELKARLGELEEKLLLFYEELEKLNDKVN